MGRKHKTRAQRPPGGCVACEHASGADFGRLACTPPCCAPAARRRRAPPSWPRTARGVAMNLGARIPDIPASEILLGEVLGAGEGSQGEVRRGTWRRQGTSQDVAV